MSTIGKGLDKPEEKAIPPPGKLLQLSFFSIFRDIGNWSNFKSTYLLVIETTNFLYFYCFTGDMEIREASLRIKENNHRMKNSFLKAKAVCN